eukprot:superscaffoldBa00004589_g19127
MWSLDVEELHEDDCVTDEGGGGGFRLIGCWHRMLDTVLWLLPSLLCDNLLCYFSPVLEKEEKFKLIVTERPVVLGLHGGDEQLQPGASNSKEPTTP